MVRVCKIGIKLIVLIGILLFQIFCCVDPVNLSAKTDEPTFRYGFSPRSNYAYKDSEGIWRGIDIEYIEGIAQEGGFKVQLVPLNNDEEVAGEKQLDNGDIDILANVVKDNNLNQKYLFSEYSVGSTSVNIMVKNKQTKFAYGDLEQINQMKLAVNQKVLLITFTKNGL